jgi:sulfopyruvate decarboxylase TPP-binding subunit
MGGASWSKHVADALRRNDIRFFATVPDYIVSQVLEHLWADPACRVVTATREEEALGIVSGVWLGGQRGALLMQNSGLGNCVKIAAGRAEGKLDRDVVGYARRFREALAALPARTAP